MRPVRVTSGRRLAWIYGCGVLGRVDEVAAAERLLVFASEGRQAPLPDLLSDVVGMLWGRSSW
jgi:hypothetical protein